MVSAHINLNNDDSHLKKIEELTHYLTDRDTNAKELLKVYKLLSDKLPIAVWVCEGSGHTELVNNKWSQWTGLTESQCHHDGWLQGIAPEDRERVFRSWKFTANNDNLWSTKYTIQNVKSKIRFTAIAHAIKVDNKWFGITVPIVENLEAIKI